MHVSDINEQSVTSLPKSSKNSYALSYSYRIFIFLCLGFKEYGWPYYRQHLVANLFYKPQKIDTPFFTDKRWPGYFVREVKKKSGYQIWLERVVEFHAKESVCDFNPSINECDIKLKISVINNDLHSKPLPHQIVKLVKD